jgi:hypothetical protein
MKRAFAALAAMFAALFATGAHAEWQQDDNGIAWLKDGKVVWKYDLDPAKGKPHFSVLGLPGGPSLVIASPDDHPWHYGLWFSWKYVNGANYWEQSRETGKAEGVTSWKSVGGKNTKGNGSGSITLLVTYTNPNGKVDLTEKRDIRVSPLAADGRYFIHWTSDFTAGAEGALLDRTPMPGEPKGQVNGGYGGLGVRLLAPPYAVSFLTAEGAITTFKDNRARPETVAVAANFTENGKPVGGIVVASSIGRDAAKVPWYVVDASSTDAQMRFFNQSLLAPKVIRLAPGEKLHLDYQIGIAPAWTPETLPPRMH